MIRVQREDFDPGAELEKLGRSGADVGGICAFVGLVRDLSEGRAVSSMTLEHYPGMTEKELTRIEAEARERWPLKDVIVIHRYGQLDPGDRIVLVATASAHRQAAFDSCHFLIDWLKTRAPFWKSEESEDGAKWVDARESDTDAAERWNKS
ncbi:MAG: molybdenum cofactor biosynthesis protein MoaE [Rhodospirillales bacterium]|nr:molybdenum cofactor biosynthesis protein MoaE [Rhodospirillales bacterium]